MSTDTIAKTSMPADIPKTRIKSECFPLFEGLGDVALEDLCAGAAIGSGTTTGAVNKMLSFVRKNKRR